MTTPLASARPDAARPRRGLARLLAPVAGAATTTGTPRRRLRCLALALPALLATSTVAGVAAAPLTSTAHAATNSGVSWPSGVFLGTGANTATVNKFATWRGSSVSYAELYAPRDSWAHMANDLWLVKQYAGFGGKLSIGLPLTIGSTSLSAVANGSADSYFKTFAKNLAALGRGNSDLRVGWEFNGSWYGWSAFSPATYLAAFRRVANILHAALPNATIDWNGNWGGSQCKHDPFTELYPGNSYVDVVSLDAYDGGWVAANTAAKFQNWQNYSHSLQAWYNFAVNHGKKFAMAEWGLVKNGEKDNPVFIKGMYDFFAAHASHIAYESYFDSTGSALWSPNEYPKSAGEYRSLWSSSAAAAATKAAPRMTASVSDASITKGHRTTLSAHRLPGSATGTVSFDIGSFHLCSGALSGGTAHCATATSLRPGIYNVTGRWDGNAQYSAGTAKVTFVVQS